MNQILFENAGEIDLRTITTFGCCVKETENPIGYFGTGLKYALAVLLRTGHAVSIQVGEKQFRLVAEPGQIRSKAFSFLRLVGENTIDLGFTTELGKNWEPWMAYRELYCNAMDELSGEVKEVAAIPQPKKGTTRVCVSGDGITEAHRRKHEFILSGEPDATLGTLEVFFRPNRHFFYRGIRVYEYQYPSLFTYNETANMKLTEDRTLAETHWAIYNPARALLQYADEHILAAALVAEKGTAEHCFDYHGWGVPASDCFFRTVMKLQKDSLTRINPSALAVWRESSHGYIDPRRIHLSPVQAKMLAKAIDFCEVGGFPLRDQYPIIPVETLGTGGVALADRKGRQIFLAAAAFESGTKYLASTLIEEYVHLRHGYNDLSGEMQTFLFNKLVSLMEELNGEPV